MSIASNTEPTVAATEETESKFIKYLIPGSKKQFRGLFRKFIYYFLRLPTGGTVYLFELFKAYDFVAYGG